MKQAAMLYEKLDNNRVHCFLCNHSCRINPGQFGLCGVRKNEKGTLFTLVYAEPIALNVDPIEKKPFYHVLPGSQSYSIATMGCNFRCGFCQNWRISQLSKKDEFVVGDKDVPPQEIAAQAKRMDCKSIAYTYTEPTIFFEYAFDTAREASRYNLLNVFVTNGFMSTRCLDTISGNLSAANVDLKSFSEEFYTKKCNGRLKPVLDSIVYMKKLNIWVEITTLLIPGENDSDQELRDIAQFIAGIDTNIPWHISKFHPDYKFDNHPATSIETLKRAARIGKESGLHYVYMGNVSEGSNTYCQACNALLIKRDYFYASGNNMQGSKCHNCQAEIPGIWE